MQQVLEHHALHAGGLELAQPGGDLLGRAGDPLRRRLVEAMVAQHPLGVVAGERERGHERERDRLAADLAAGGGDRLAAFAALVGGREDRVVLVGPAGGERSAALARLAAGDERHAAQRLRLRVGIHERVVAAREAERLRVERAADDLELLGVAVEAVARGLEREAVARVLVLVPARAEPELDPAAGDVVGRDGLARQHRRVAEGRGRDQRAEPQRGGLRGERDERAPGVERAAVRLPVERLVVVRAEEGLEAGGLGGGRQAAPLIPRDAVLALDHQADAHAR